MPYELQRPRKRPLCLASLCHTCGRGRLASTKYTRSWNGVVGKKTELQTLEITMSVFRMSILKLKYKLC